MANLSETIEDAAASVDGQSVTARRIPDLIAADRYLASKTAAGSAKGGLAIPRISPPGTISETRGEAAPLNDFGRYACRTTT